MNDNNAPLQSSLFTLFLLMTLKTWMIPCMLPGPAGMAGCLSVLPELATSWMWFLFQLESCGRLVHETGSIAQYHSLRIIDMFWFPKGFFFFFFCESHPLGFPSAWLHCLVLFLEKPLTCWASNHSPLWFGFPSANCVFTFCHKHGFPHHDLLLSYLPHYLLIISC